MKPTFPYFGGKRRIADKIWQRFGNPKRYIEPFCGGASVYLARPHNDLSDRDEIINDLDGFVVNFYRAAKYKPDELADRLDWFCSELDLHARRDWLQNVEGGLRQKLRADPEYCNVKVAAWWCWGACYWIGGHWPEKDSGIKPCIARKRGNGILGGSRDSKSEIETLTNRLSCTKILCGDWKRCVSSKTVLFGDYANTGVFLDPPYPSEHGSSDVYSKDSDSVYKEVEQFCREWGGDERIKIAACGYEGQYDLPNSWEVVSWAASGGYANQGETDNDNKNRERVWLSPGCKPPPQSSLI